MTGYSIMFIMLITLNYTQRTKISNVRRFVLRTNNINIKHETYLKCNGKTLNI